ncbi:MAG TPA: hypothetical protein VF458_20345 [Ktedonobacteraceae bacterium]
MAHKQSKPIIVDSTGYAIRSEEEEETLFTEKARLKAKFEEECLPLHEALAQDRRETMEFWGDLEWSNLHWWQKIGRAH